MEYSPAKFEYYGMIWEERRKKELAESELQKQKEVKKKEELKRTSTTSNDAD